MSQIIEYLQLNKTAYTGFTPLSMSSTNIDICINNIDFRMVSLQLSLSVSHCINCAYWDHEEKKQKVCFITHSFLDNVWDYPKFQGFSVNDCDNQCMDLNEIL